MSTSTLITFVVIGLLIALASPILVIWSLNTLFGLSIAYGFFEWLAALFLFGMVTGNGIKFRKE